MRDKFLLPFLFCLFVFALVLVFTINIKGEHLSFLESAAIAISSKQVSEPQPTPIWSLLAKILEPDPEFDNIQLTVGTQDIAYFEERFLRDRDGNVNYDSNGLPRKERIARNRMARRANIILPLTSTALAVFYLPFPTISAMILIRFIY